MPIEFPGSSGPTIGVEIELQTIDPRTKALVPLAPKILELNLDPDHIKKELLQSNIELNTPVCEGVEQVEEELLKRLTLLFEVGKEKGVSFISAGTHPFSHWQTQSVTQDERYQAQLERIRWSGYRLSTFGLHVHVGVGSGEKAVAFMNVMTSYLPHLLALSASSPFWNGIDTGLASVRSKVFESLPGGGIPYRQRNWASFQSLLKTFIKSRTISSIQEIWWDVRPHTKYGTLEIRICDSMSSMWELLAVVALIQSLVVWMELLYDRGIFLDLPRHWVISENKWRAARWGLESRLITDDKGSQLHIATVLEELMDDLAAVAQKLGCLDYLLRIQEILRNGGSVVRQRRVYEEKDRKGEAVACFLEQELIHSIGDGKKAVPPRPQ